MIIQNEFFVHNVTGGPFHNLPEDFGYPVIFVLFFLEMMVFLNQGITQGEFAVAAQFAV
jgi:hypothetical protein